MINPRILVIAWVVVGLCCFRSGSAQNPAPQQSEPPLFGTTVVIPAGLHGQIYFIRHGSRMLPNFEKLKPAGTIYATKLNIPSREFKAGFPGVTHRFEWFAIDYSGRFWIEKPGEYRFALTSDDGSKLYIDDGLVIDNDGTHPPRREEGMVTLSRGIHLMRVSYFQGPRFQVALVLEVARPDEDFVIFDIDDFRPAAGP